MTGPGVVALPSRIAPIDIGEAALVYREDHLFGDLESRLAEISFYVPEYMGGSECFAVMESMPTLAVCQLLTAGFESAIPFLPPGVTLCNAGGVHDASTAELAIGLIIASLRGIDDAIRAQAERRWDHRTHVSLADRRVVIVGAGGVGQAIRRRLEPFEVEAVLVGRTSRPGVTAAVDLPRLLPGADVVVLAVPLAPDTAGMVDRGFLAAMADGALLVNVARGAVVDTDALVAELAAGRLRAALDVTDPEPLPPEHPLWGAPGLILTPHVGGDSTAFEPRARHLVRGQVRRWRTGSDLAHVVAPTPPT